MTAYELKESAGFEYFDDCHSYRFYFESYNPLKSIIPPVIPNGSYPQRFIWGGMCVCERERKLVAFPDVNRGDLRLSIQSRFCLYF